MKRSQKRLLRITGLVLGIALIIGVFFQSFVFVDTSYHGTVRCDKQEGCTDGQIAKCEANTEDLESREGWECDRCKVTCSNTQEMRTLSNTYFNPCWEYYGGGALVEVKAQCTLKEPESRTKSGCVKGTKSVFDGTLVGTNGGKYPSDIDFEDADVWWFNEIDKAEEIKEKCASDELCQQYTSTKAKCIDKDSDEVYVMEDHKGCFVISSRWEVWWFDSNNKISQRIEICEEFCEDGECVEPGAGSGDDNGDDEGGSSSNDCTYGVCEEDTTYTCNSGTTITAYTCEDGCAIPTTEVCPEDEGNIPVFSGCKTWERETITGNCVFDINSLDDTSILTNLIKDNSIVFTVVLGLLLIVGALFLTHKKSSGGFSL